MKRTACLLPPILFLSVIGIYFFSSQALFYNGNDAIEAMTPIHQTLKVMTFNIRGGRDDARNLRLDGILDEIQRENPDIIGMQEVDVRLPRSHFSNEVEEISKRLHYNFVFVPNVNFLIGSYGDAILSRFPITSYSHFKLPSGIEPRGALEASVPFHGKTIHIYNTHFGLNLTERKKQFSVLSSILVNDEHPKIVLGDFNTKPNERSMESFRKQLGESSSRQRKLITLRPEHSQIDYIFKSKDFTSVYSKVVQSDISDHNPLVTHLELTSGLQVPHENQISLFSNEIKKW